jgi:hypothetical protein
MHSHRWIFHYKDLFTEDKSKVFSCTSCLAELPEAYLNLVLNTLSIDLREQCAALDVTTRELRFNTQLYDNFLTEIHESYLLSENE